MFEEYTYEELNQMILCMSRSLNNDENALAIIIEMNKRSRLPLPPVKDNSKHYLTLRNNKRRTK